MTHEQNLSASNADMVAQAMEHPPLEIPATVPTEFVMTDRMIINALMAKLGNMVTITPSEIMDARARSTLQFDKTADQTAVVISLIPDR